LFVVGIGNPADPRGVRLHDLRVSDSVTVHDTLVFEARLTAEGFTSRDKDLTVRVRLWERGRDRPLAALSVPVDPRGLPVAVRLDHRPTDPGETVYAIDVETPPGVAAGPRLERQVTVLPARRLKVLYLESSPRYEYRALRGLLERQADRVTGEPVFDPRIILLDADGLAEAGGGRGVLPAAELEAFDLVILGDLPPDLFSPADRQALRSYVRVRGGGLVVVPGPQHGLTAYTVTPLADVLPVVADGGPSIGGDVGGPYRPVFPPHVRLPAVLGPEVSRSEVLAALPPLEWAVSGVRARPEAEVWAVHPNGLRAGADAADRRLPLMADWLPGAGRCLYLGCGETWRWRALDGAAFYDRFWLQLLRHVAQSRQGRVILSLATPGPYRRGDPLRVLAQFPEDYNSVPDAERWLLLEHVPPGATGPAGTTTRTELLHPVPGERGLYEFHLPAAAEGLYRFRLARPLVTPRPSLTCVVAGPPAEVDRAAADHDGPRAAALASGGRFFLPPAAELLGELPAGQEQGLGPVREFPLWDHPMIWGLALGLLATEWVVRRRRGLR
jgi:hypothetical protein